MGGAGGTSAHRKEEGTGLSGGRPCGQQPVKEGVETGTPVKGSLRPPRGPHWQGTGENGSPHTTFTHTHTSLLVCPCSHLHTCRAHSPGCTRAHTQVQMCTHAHAHTCAHRLPAAGKRHTVLEAESGELYRTGNTCTLRHQKGPKTLAFADDSQGGGLDRPGGVGSTSGIPRSRVP